MRLTIISFTIPKSNQIKSNVGFSREGNSKTGVPGEKPLGAE